MMIKQYLNCTDPYHLISILNPPPYLLRFIMNLELDELIHLWSTENRQTLQIHRFPFSVSLMITKAVKSGYPGGDNAINLLCIVLWENNPIPPWFGPVKDDLIQLLHC